jgi:hypothetical protein
MREKAYGYTRAVFASDWALGKSPSNPSVEERTGAKGGHRTTAEEGENGQIGQYDGVASRCK